MNGETFCNLREAQILIEERRKHYNTKRPHGALHIVPEYDDARDRYAGIALHRPLRLAQGSPFFADGPHGIRRQRFQDHAVQRHPIPVNIARKRSVTQIV